MKAGMTLEQLARTVHTQEISKQDYVVNTNVLRFETDPETKVSNLIMPSNVVNERTGEAYERRFEVLPMFHQQLAARLDIPGKYYQRLQQDVPALLDQNVNGLLQFQDERRMIRTYGTPYKEVPQARAFLSDRYRRLDNFDTVKAVLGVLSEIQGTHNISIETCNVSETTLSIKFVNPRLEADLRKNDPVQAGLTIMNSEVGKGSFIIQPFLYRLVCTNGMIMPEYAKRKYHIGRNTDTGDDVLDLTMYRDETLMADDRAFWLKMQDSMRSAVNDDIFKAMVERTQQTMGVKIEAPPQKAVVALSQTFGFTNPESDLILRHLIEGAELTGFGLIQATTRAAQDLPDYDRATYFETVGGDLASMSRADWKQIVTV